MDAHAAGDFAHRSQQWKSAESVPDRLVGDACDLGAEERVSQFGEWGEVALRAAPDRHFADELLTRLDDLVISFDREEGPEVRLEAEEASGEIGATCLYAVYDPIRGELHLSNAGHIPPAPVATVAVDLAATMLGDVRDLRRQGAARRAAGSIVRADPA